MNPTIESKQRHDSRSSMEHRLEETPRVGLVEVVVVKRITDGEEDS